MPTKTKKAPLARLAKSISEIPSTAMPKFGLAIVRVVDLTTRVYALENEVRALKIVDQATRVQAGELVTKLKRAEEDIDETIKPYKKVLKTVSDYIKKKTDPAYDLIEELRKNVLNPQMGNWDTLEERRAQAERDRVAREKQQELEREAEVQRQKDLAAAGERKKQRVDEIRADLKAGKITLAKSEQLLREAGATLEADKAQAAIKEAQARTAAVATAAAVEVEPNIPTVQGNVKRVNPKFRVVNAQQVKLKFLTPDLVAIGGVVRGADYNNDEDIKRIEEEIGGIEIYFERTY